MLMLKTVTVLEAISKRRRTARPAAHTGLSKNTIFAATHSAEDALVLLDATANGLTVEQATERLNAVGPNTIEATTKTLARRIADAFIDPFAGILAALALVSLYIDVLAAPEPQRDPSTVIVIGIMLLVSGGMKFIQEARSGNAAKALKDLVSNTCTALRDGERIEIPFDELVPGDVIRLSAGDMVPADARIITARDLFVIESALTGESEAVEKTTAVTVVEGADGSALPLSACKNIVFTGTSVQNGAAMALVVATGSDTYLGGIAKMLNGRGEKSAFDRGVSSVSMLLVRLMLVMAPAVFAINAATKGNVIDALLFATSVAVGITAKSSSIPTFLYTKLSTPASRAWSTKVISGIPVMIMTRHSGSCSLMRAAATMPLESCSVHTSISIMSGRSLSTTSKASEASAIAATTVMSGWSPTERARLSRKIAWSSTINTRIMNFSFGPWRWRRAGWTP